ncbi:recombinase family protein [Streptomyces sp. GbtcB6]|uniref:recombinase family protein n=1 Tax=Streptomyces sp. GbtcB6 TaxID=2824751 RepID=UPI001C30B1FC|nr:recombinase family protein [Streptomyces sp. GbtcB6]
MATAVRTRMAREYLRVSKGKGRTARSISDQHRENLAAEVDHGPWTWGEPYTDTGSASKFATKIRDDFEKLLADLESGEFGEPGDVLSLWEISRLARETGRGVALVDACEAGGYLIHITTHERTYNPANYQDRHDLISGINDAEKESRLLSKRTKRGVDSAVADGGVHGKLTFGFARRYAVVDGRSRPVEQYADPVEGPLVIELFERVAGWNGRERESIRAVEQDWLKRGIKSRDRTVDGETVPGVPFSRQNLGQMLRRKAYAGIRVHKGTERPGNWPALVEPALFDAVQELLADPDRKTHTGSQIKHVLTGVLRCSTCGGKVSVRPGGDAYEGRLVYRCWDRDCFTIDKAATDAFMIGDAEHHGLIIRLLTSPHLYRAPADEESAELADARGKLTAKQRSLKEFEDADPATPAAADLIGRKIEKLRGEITELESKIKDLTPRPSAGDHLDLGPDADRAAAWSAWEAAQLPVKRALVADLLNPEMFGTPRVRRVADSVSPAPADRIEFVNEDGEDLLTEWGLKI